MSSQSSQIFSNKSSKLAELARKNHNITSTTTSDTYNADSTEAIRNLYRVAMSQGFNREVYAQIETALEHGLITSNEAENYYVKMTAGHMTAYEFSLIARK